MTAPIVSLALLVGFAAPLAAQSRPRFSNPPGLPPTRGYSHLVEVPAGSRFIVLAGQVPLDSAGRLVGGTDFRAQTAQVFENIGRGLAAAGAGFKDIVKVNYYLLDVANLAALREVRDRYFDPAAPPASTLVQVAALFRPDVLVEIEVTAVAPPR